MCCKDGEEYSRSVAHEWTDSLFIKFCPWCGTDLKIAAEAETQPREPRP